jgi:hypothetical protein
MNDISDHPAPLSMEEGCKILLSNVRQGIRHRYQKCEGRVRKHPTSAVLGAVATGYLLHRMPVRAILVTQVRVLTALTAPALFLYGAAKLYDLLQRQELTKPK